MALTLGPRFLVTPFAVSSSAAHLMQEWQRADARNFFAIVTLAMIVHLTPVIDLRSELYSAGYIRDYLNTQEVRAGWQTFLDRTKPRYALLRAKAPLTVALQEQLKWTTVGEDASYVLLKAPDRSG